MKTAALLFVSVFLGMLRAGGFRGQAFQAVAHLFVGGLFAAYFAAGDKECLAFGIGLSVVEVVCFVTMPRGEAPMEKTATVKFPDASTETLVNERSLDRYVDLFDHIRLAVTFRPHTVDGGMFLAALDLARPIADYPAVNNRCVLDRLYAEPAGNTVELILP